VSERKVVWLCPCGEVFDEKTACHVGEETIAVYADSIRRSRNTSGGERVHAETVEGQE